MKTITHRHLTVNGLALHVAEKGPLNGPAILFLHGFPELWYTWRSQMLALSAKGYRAIAPDLRGYGDSANPSSSTEYTSLHVVGDLVALIQSLDVGAVFVVGHDWGAMMGWYLCLYRPDLVKAFVSLTVPFRPRNPKVKPVDAMKASFGVDYYMCRFQKRGDMEDEIAKYGSKEVLKKIITGQKPGLPIMPKENPFGINLKTTTPLPCWFSEEDLNYYADKFDKTGFTGGLNYYRALDMNWELTAPWSQIQVKVPVKFIVGDLDLTYTTPGVKEYVHGGGFKLDVPLLDDVVVLKDVGHFINQERADDINSLIYDFFSKF
uniref:soluble epoxide hydrolase n=1 Tax=Kalanchoe fedtschenkoi TaxID=63787 RepID=A0A7N0T529_KALFE